MIWNKESFDDACIPLNGFDFVIPPGNTGVVIYDRNTSFNIYVDHELQKSTFDVKEIISWLNENEAVAI